jgi:hypothetical protein
MVGCLFIFERVFEFFVFELGTVLARWGDEFL